MIPVKKPVIGLIPLVDEERESLWMLPGYPEGLSAAGALPVTLPLTADEADLRQLIGTLDGLLLTGGHDVQPSLYGEAALPGVCCCPARDEMERKLLALALERDLPVLGICRGIQFLNAALGGTLWQDLPTQRPTSVEHHQKPPYDRPAHTVTVLPATPLAAAVGAGVLPVNSYHHQAVKALAPALRPMALSEDGLVEAVWHPGKRFVWAVQWHPEFAWKTSRPCAEIFRVFVEAAKSADAAKN